MTAPSQEASARSLIETWLPEGGDSRIRLNDQGLNTYGYPPYPLPGLMAFGSSTASAISPGGYQAAMRLHQRLPEPLSAEKQMEEWQRVRLELAGLLGWGDSPPALVFGRSGSHMHLLAAQLLRDDDGELPTTILADGTETGRYVPEALAGYHFGEAGGGRRAIGDKTGRVLMVPVWQSGGVLRPSQALDEDIIRRVEQAAAGSRRLLLVMLDVSKSGLILPSMACMLTLKARYGERLTVLVDACQFRCSASTLKRYLEAGCLVTLTGSKFLGGPAFSGALLIPEGLAVELATTPLSRHLSAYTSRSDWPLVWPGANGLSPDGNRGLLLRWEAALFELQCFMRLPEADIYACCCHFRETLQEALLTCPAFKPLMFPPLDRRALRTSSHWDDIPTILPFILRHQGTDQPLGPNDTLKIFQRCRTEEDTGMVALGQPVYCGEQPGQVPFTALRLALGAGQIVEAIHTPDILVGQALQGLERLQFELKRQTLRMACPVNGSTGAGP